MGRRGPKPKPTAMLRLEGSWRANDRGDDLAVPHEIPTAPAWLVGDALAVFNDLSGNLFQLPGLLTATDAEALAQLSAAVVEFRQHTQTLSVEGYTTETADGCLKAHPVVYIRQQAWARCRAGFQHFGLTPADRVGLRLEAPSDRANRKAIGLGPGA